MCVCGQLAARTNQGSLFCSLGWVNCLLTFSVVNREKSRGRMCICVCVSVCRTEMPIQQLKRDHCRAQLPPLAPYRPSIPLTPSVYPSLYFTPHISTGSTFLFFSFFFLNCCTNLHCFSCTFPSNLIAMLPMFLRVVYSHVLLLHASSI